MSTTADTTAAADADTMVLVPKPDKIIKYKTVCNNESVLYLYGSEKSEKIAILCAGFPDDHTVFQSFACELAKQGNTFVGIMCLPGYDDRPNDGMPWTSHRSDGYTFNDWSNSIRDAVKALRAESTFIGGVEKTKFTGIFHDWAVAAGTIWLNRTLESSSASPQDNIIFKPNNIIYFDVLLRAPHSKSIELPNDTTVKKPTTKQLISEWLYKIVLAKSFLIQRYVSKHVAAVGLIIEFTLLGLFKLDPLFPFDKTTKMYKEKNKQKSLFNIMYMAYPYWNLFKAITGTGSDKGSEFTLHNDWKTTPILFMYGKEKKCNFHDVNTVALLEREEQLALSNSKVIAVEDAGHYLYTPLQKQNICLNSVIKFMDAA